MFRRIAPAALLALAAISCGDGSPSVAEATAELAAEAVPTTAPPPPVTLVAGDRPTEMTREAGDPRTVGLGMLERFDARYRSALLGVAENMGAGPEDLDYWQWTEEAKLDNALEHACATQDTNGVDPNGSAMVAALGPLLAGYGVEAGALLADTAQLNRDLIALGLCNG